MQAPKSRSSSEISEFDHYPATRFTRRAVRSNWINCSRLLFGRQVLLAILVSSPPDIPKSTDVLRVDDQTFDPMTDRCHCRRLDLTPGCHVAPLDGEDWTDGPSAGRADRKVRPCQHAFHADQYPVARARSHASDDREDAGAARRARIQDAKQLYDAKDAEVKKRLTRLLVNEFREHLRQESVELLAALDARDFATVRRSLARVDKLRHEYNEKV